MRFSEALALTPNDFDLSRQILSINKTGITKEVVVFFQQRINLPSVKSSLTGRLLFNFLSSSNTLPEDEPIFVRGKAKIYNSTVNKILTKKCKKVDRPNISIHGLRHTHASLLLFAGVSIASVARRLGHASMTTTQRTYLHIIQELENQDVDLVMRSMSGLS